MDQSIVNELEYITGKLESEESLTGKLLKLLLR